MILASLADVLIEVAAALAGIATILSAYFGIKRLRQDTQKKTQMQADIDCHERLMKAYQEAEDLATTAHERHMSELEAMEARKELPP